MSGNGKKPPRGDLSKQGIPHGRRMTSPNPNSGGLPNFRRANVVGSAAYQRTQTGSNRGKKASQKAYRPATVR